MKHYYKILYGLGILFLLTRLSSCSIAIKAVYNQFSDEDEFVLFQKERKTQTSVQNLKTVGQQPKNDVIAEDESELDTDLVDNF